MRQGGEAGLPRPHRKRHSHEEDEEGARYPDLHSRMGVVVQDLAQEAILTEALELGHKQRLLTALIEVVLMVLPKEGAREAEIHTRTRTVLGQVAEIPGEVPHQVISGHHVQEMTEKVGLLARHLDRDVVVQEMMTKTTFLEDRLRMVDDLRNGGAEER